MNVTWLLHQACKSSLASVQVLCNDSLCNDSLNDMKLVAMEYLTSVSNFIIGFSSSSIDEVHETASALANNCILIFLSCSPSQMMT